MLLHKPIDHDARVRREACALTCAGHRVVVVDLPRRPRGPRIVDGASVRSATPPAWVRERLPFALYRVVFLVRFVAAALRARPDAVQAHDAAMLAPGAIAAWATGARLIYDSHELATGVPYRERLWAWFVGVLERLLIGRCEAVITVSDGIADALQRRYRLARRPAVVRNLPRVEPGGEGDDAPRPPGADGAPLVIHHGSVAPGRGAETLVEAVARLPATRLLLLGAEADRVAALRALAARLGCGDRVHALEAVPLASVLGHTRQADVGVSLLEDSCENHRLALPNKVFEYLAAGVPVVCADLPELARLVRETGAGELADPADPASVAGAIRRVLEDNHGEGRLRAAARAAGARLTWEREQLRLVSLYEELGRR